MRKMRNVCGGILGIALSFVAGVGVPPGQPEMSFAQTQPNVLLILTDDQDTESLDRMANVQSLLVNQGTNFSNAFATTPSCCPSRVSFMRGQYVHNHGVLTNDDERPAGYEAFIRLGLHKSTVATWIDEAGYATFYAGKFMNGYQNTTRVPPGWDRWYAFTSGVGREYTVNDNGDLKTYTQAQKHETYYLRDRAEAFIRDHDQGSPWFAMVATHAPHKPHTVATGFHRSYDDAEMPTPPSYNEADVDDKPAWIRKLRLVDSNCRTSEPGPDCHRAVVREWRERQEALLSVDVMVRDLIEALVETGQVERTHVVFTSDNGFLLYRHRKESKGAPYEESQGVPFVVRGPGVRQGVVSDELVANIDLAPTIADWVGVQAPGYVDGRSLRPLLEGTATSWRRYLLFEYFAQHAGGAPPYGGVRTLGGETYVEYKTGEREYYDLTRDPWQLDSAHAAPENAERLKTLSAVLIGLKDCAAAECQEREDTP